MHYKNLYKETPQLTEVMPKPRKMQKLPALPPPSTIGGLPFGMHRDVLEAMKRARRDLAPRAFGGPADAEHYATWVGLELLRMLVEERDLTWTPGAASKRRGFTPLLDRLAPAARILPDVDIPDTLRSVRKKLRTDLFRLAYWVPLRQLNKICIAGAWKAVNGSYPAPAQLSDYADRLDKRQPVMLNLTQKFTHMATGDLLVAYGIATPLTHDGKRGFVISWDRLNFALDYLDGQEQRRTPPVLDGLWEEGESERPSG